MAKVAFVLNILVASALLAMVPVMVTAQSRETNPIEAGNIIDEIVPQPGAVWDVGVNEPWFGWKDSVYDRTGLKFGFSYQMLGQYATDTLPDATYDTALGHWWGFLAKWTMLDRGGNHEGTLVFSMFERNAVGNHQVPATFGFADIGSLTANVGFTSWDFVIENLYWEQWFKSENSEFMLRVGNQVVTTLLNPFRFKDERVSYTFGDWAFHPAIPWPTFGFGTGFKWWPEKESGLYVAGSLNDMNSNPALGFDWSTVSEHQYFYGLEFGYDWNRSKDDRDHVHLLLFYADERSSRSPDTLPNKAGGGFRLLGEKQWGRWVGFAGYTYNTAEGGGVTGTFVDNNFTLGAAYLNPADIRGEVSFSLLYQTPIEEIFPEARDQYGIEAYWRISLTKNIWITPGVHLIFDPALNPDHDFIAIPQLKFRVAL